MLNYIFTELKVSGLQQLKHGVEHKLKQISQIRAVELLLLSLSLEVFKLHVKKVEHQGVLFHHFADQFEC